MNNTQTAVWPTLIYKDAPAAIEFLKTAFGFTESMVVKNEQDETIIEHCQLRWPQGGGVMLGTANRPDSEFSKRPTGHSSAYLVTPDPDSLFEQATAAGAKVFRELDDTDYGSRDFSASDPEGNLWNFGTYAGED